MKTISMIGLAAALCVPAMASAQRGDQTGAAGIQRFEQRRDADRTGAAVRNLDVVRGNDLRGEIATGTRIRPLPPRTERPGPGEAHSPARRRWYNATHGKVSPSQARRRWYNATHPPAPAPSRPRGGR